jgi:ABC-2 type transport system permease protein
LGAKVVQAGVSDLLAHYGFTVEPSLVLDSQNEPFPLPVVRQVGDYQVQEIQPLNYPFFVDIRPDGMAQGNPVVSTLPAVTLNWASPIAVDPAKNAAREVATLLTSSAGSWVAGDYNIQPDLDLYPEIGFPTVAETRPYTLAVTAMGVFESYFKGRPSPLEQPPAEGVTAPVAAPGSIDISPATSRLVVIGSFEFVDDLVLQLSQTLRGQNYLNSLKLLQNAVAWAVEDTELLGIRARGATARVLVDMDEQEQSFWEAANYVVALLALGGVSAIAVSRRRGEQPLDLEPAETIADPGSEQEVA